MQTVIEGRAYVLGDNVDTDQIIPAEYLTYNPAIPEEYKMFGKFALSGVPAGGAGLPKGHIPFHTPGGDEYVSPYKIIVGGKNFGCGSSREHAPIALAAAGIACVVAEFYARIFYRNSINGAYLVPIESEARLADRVCTGDTLRIDLAANELVNQTTGDVWKLRPLGDVVPIIEAGGIFEYAKSVGMLPAGK
ncbi:3-isopropylmalate dehydratase [Fimbriiglobus ruber]|uniref:3-isopropylmalate dehydratase n=1 Tax=Fimbriiglobus ruber TaxID=1908690 RepID=A0A225DVX3_9BACT|nr:3-isopropylmalate dehydratase [Fimbriiglobus ruber]OWK45183.1 3-isopropylmalate dehydratase small subunit [Fimbriiglobus ruber]